MSHLVPLQEFYRQQADFAKVVPGVGWEERVAALERMQEAMKNSGWPKPKQEPVRKSPPRSANAPGRKT
jgi:hypothetical protein